jgi:hypothetical protein
MTQWFESFFACAGPGYPDPDWEAISAEVERRYPEDEWHDIWCEIARYWTGRIRDLANDGYRIQESAQFLLLSNADEAKATETLERLDKIDAEVRKEIAALLPEVLYGKCPVLLFAKEQHFYEYASHFIEEDGELGTFGGIYLNKGYGHILIGGDDLGAFCHELCHSYLHHLGLPLWLDEAITMDAEHSVTHARPYELSYELVRRHKEYWDEERIQEFWDGISFGMADEAQALSYHLARFILNLLYQGGETPRADMEAFFLKARYEDAGQSAALEVLGVSLGDCVRALLGEGAYDPAEPHEIPWAVT